LSLLLPINDRFMNAPLWLLDIGKEYDRELSRRNSRLGGE
jgi:hypothetical protein